MKTVRDASELQPNALNIKLADQIEQLDQLIQQEGDGSAFFEKTHITQGMMDLATEGLARLSGSSTQGLFHLKQAMGGGKTHLLVGFGLLAKNPSLRKTYFKDSPQLEGLVDAEIAAFNGRNSPDCYFWGEIANQLQKGDLFKKFWKSGPDAPDEKDWLELFSDSKPILILLDEMPPYFHIYNTKPVGNGTVADIATRAFANLLTAAGKKKNVCVVVSDLEAAYESGSSLINRALEDAKSELGRGVRIITPVDLSNNEIYDILKKRLFKKLPSDEDVQAIADAYGKSLAEASRARTAGRGAEALANEIVSTYPFHPRLKNVIALFKENEKFKQTRGLIELVSRLLRSVWSRSLNDVYLIGPQHFDLSDSLIRDKLNEISGMRDVIARDLWDSQLSAHAQLVDLPLNKDPAAQVGTLLLTASLSTAVNAVKGLTKEEMVECLITPSRNGSEFLSAFEELEKRAWYLHYTQDEKFYFDRQENLTKLLQSLAEEAPENQIEDLIRNRLSDMFKPTRKTVYNEILPLPRLDDISDRIRKNRVLLVVSPDSKVPPEDVARLFGSVTQKNNVCILTGDKTAMGSVEKGARQLFAVKKAGHRLPQGHPQRDELDRKTGTYDLEFTSTITNLFDKVLFPIQRAGRDATLVAKTLDLTRDTRQPFNGEEQIQKTLTADPIKLVLDIEKDFDTVRDKAQDLLWPTGLDEVRWTDAEDRYCEQAGMFWLPPRGLETLKARACAQGLWEDMGNGYVTKNPKKKKTSVQIIPEGEQHEDGTVRLKVNSVNSGYLPQIHYTEDGRVTDQSPKLKELFLTTKAVKVEFLAVDPTHQCETGDPYVWKNMLSLRANLTEVADKRQVELRVAPRGNIRYSLDGTEPRNGQKYEGPFSISDDAVVLLVFAEADGVESRRNFSFAVKGKSGLIIDDIKPATVIARAPKKVDSTSGTFAAIKIAKEKAITFEGVTVTIGQGNKVGSFMLGEIEIDALFLESLVIKLQEKFSVDSPVIMVFKKANFASGHDLKVFKEKLGIELREGEVEQ